MMEDKYRTEDYGDGLKEGVNVKIKATKSAKDKNASRVGLIGTISALPQNQNAWYTVRFADGDERKFRIHSLEVIGGSDDDSAKTRGNSSEDQEFDNLSRASKSSKSSKSSSADYIGKDVKIVYGRNLDDVGRVIAILPGYLVIKVIVNKNLENPEYSSEVIRKRKNHCQVISEIDTEVENASSPETKEEMNFNASNRTQIPRAPLRKPRKKRFVRTAKQKAYAKPSVARLLRKKVAVVSTGLVGKVVYYDPKRDTYTVRLNENNPYNLKRMEESEADIDISCKVKVSADEIMLWEEYKLEKGIVEERDIMRPEAPVPGGVSFKIDQNDSDKDSVEDPKNRTERAATRETRRAQTGSGLMSSGTTHKFSNIDLQTALPKMLKARRTALQQYVKVLEEREKKLMPDRPNLTELVKKIDSEISCDFTVFEDALKQAQYDSVNDNLTSGLSGLDRERSYLEICTVQNALIQPEEVLITISNIPTTSILGQKRNAAGESTNFKEFEEICDEIEDQRSVGKYRLFYNPPVCLKCGMEKLSPCGICWNNDCSTDDEERVDAYTYNELFKPSEMVSRLVKIRKEDVQEIKVETTKVADVIEPERQEPKEMKPWFSRGIAKMITEDNTKELRNLNTFAGPQVDEIVTVR